MNTSIHSRIISSSQMIETTQMSISGWLDRSTECGIYIHTIGHYLTLSNLTISEDSSDMNYNMDETWGQIS